MLASFGQIELKSLEIRQYYCGFFVQFATKSDCAILALDLISVSIIYAEEYKKASGKIDTFFKKLYDADYKLQWIGIDKLNRDQLIDLVILFIGRQSKYKDIYNNLKHPNTLFNYFGMMIGDNDLSAVLPNASPAVPLAFF